MNNRNGTLRGLAGAAAVLVVLLAIAGCGGGDESTGAAETSAADETSASTAVANVTFLGAGETGLGIRPGEGEQQEKSEKAGTEAGETKDEATLPEAKIGIINYVNGIESGDRLADSATYAAAQLGWTTIVCDGKGVPSNFVTCGNSLLAQGVDAILLIAIEPGMVKPVIAKARGKGVPMVQIGGGEIPLGEFNGNYGPDEEVSGDILTEALMTELESLDGNPEIAVHEFPAKWGVVRLATLEDAVAAQSKVTIGDSVVTDAADLVPFTRNAVTTQITQNPDLKAFWFTFDTAGQIGGQVVASKFPGKAFPDRPLVATFHADHATLAFMAQGDIDLVSDVNFDVASWEGIDGIAQELAREEPMSTDNQPVYEAIGDPYTYQIVSSENLPPEGQYPEAEWDVPAYFIAKWRAEYGL